MDILVFFQYHLQEMILSTLIIITIRNGALLIIFSFTGSEAAVRTVLHVAPSFGNKFDSPMSPVFFGGKNCVEYAGDHVCVNLTASINAKRELKRPSKSKHLKDQL